MYFLTEEELEDLKEVIEENTDAVGVNVKHDDEVDGLETILVSFFTENYEEEFDFCPDAFDDVHDIKEYCIDKVNSIMY